MPEQVPGQRSAAVRSVSRNATQVPVRPQSLERGFKPAQDGVVEALWETDIFPSGAAHSRLRGVLNLKRDPFPECGEGRLDLIQARMVVEVE